MVILLVALVNGGLLACSKMRMDNFSSLANPKTGALLADFDMIPGHNERSVAGHSTHYFQHVDSIQDISSRNIQQLAWCGLSFFPASNTGQALTQVVVMSDRAMSWMPKLHFPPMIMQRDAASVSIGDLVLQSET